MTHFRLFFDSYLTLIQPVFDGYLHTAAGLCCFGSILSLTPSLTLSLTLTLTISLTLTLTVTPALTLIGVCYVDK